MLPADPPPTLAGSGGARVLVVDDDTKLADVLARALERAGYVCEVATSGDQALWHVNRERPDALVLDVMIPLPGGVEVCRHLRSGGYSGAVVVISARAEPGDCAAALRAGADIFLAKPFPLRQLISTLDDLVQPALYGTEPTGPELS